MRVSVTHYAIYIENCNNYCARASRLCEMVLVIRVCVLTDNYTQVLPCHVCDMLSYNVHVALP